MSNAIDVAHLTTVHRRTDNRIFRKECVALQQAGLAVALVAVGPQDEIVDGVRLVALPRRRGRLRRALLGSIDAWRALTLIRPGMIHVHDPELIPLAIFWRLLRRRPAVFDAHEDLAKQVAGKTYLPRRLRPPVAWLARRLEVAADAGLTGVVAATPAIARNFGRAPVTLVQNFPWMRDFAAPMAPRSDLPLTLAYVGGITRERGCLEMVEAVRQSARSPRLVLAGPASADMVTAMDADDSGRIEFRGSLPAEEVPGIIAESHAGIVLLHPLPNYLESQPTKLFEYMAGGRPFIASRFPSWLTLLGPWDCGFFLDPLDVDALTETIDWLHQHPREAEAMGERGRRALAAHFTFETESERLVGLTRRLLGQSTPANDAPPPTHQPTTTRSSV